MSHTVYIHFNILYMKQVHESLLFAAVRIKPPCLQCHQKTCNNNAQLTGRTVKRPHRPLPIQADLFLLPTQQLSPFLGRHRSHDRQASRLIVPRPLGLLRIAGLQSAGGALYRRPSSASVANDPDVDDGLHHGLHVRTSTTAVAAAQQFWFSGGPGLSGRQRRPLFAERLWAVGERGRVSLAARHEHATQQARGLSASYNLILS